MSFESIGGDQMKSQNQKYSPLSALKQGSLVAFFVLILSWAIGGAISPLSAQTQTLTTLVNLVTSSSGFGYSPYAGLIQGNDGNFYSTTSDGASAGVGTVFKLTPAGTLTNLAILNSGTGHSSFADVVQGNDGNYYGTGRSGGSSSQGTVFRVSPGGAATTLVNFSSSNGSAPYAGLVLGSDGNFYGTTYQGGSSTNCTSGCGTVFRMTPGGALTTLVNFTNLNGARPTGNLIQGSDGNFYGTTNQGGSSSNCTGGCGTMFRITPTGTLTTLVFFDSFTNGANPYAGLIQGSDGNFYGTTYVGGFNGYGTVFRVTPTGSFTTLVDFNFNNGANPLASLIQANDGNFYGTTYQGGNSTSCTNGCGTAFKMALDGTVTTLVNFSSTNGAKPRARLLQGSDGNLYGTTYQGGSSNVGTVFRLNLGLPPTGPLFYAVTPCRIIDTRNTTTPALPINTTVSFKANLVGPTGSYATQGGSTSGCGIPTDAKAIFFNFVAVNVSGSGYLQAWAFGSPIPTASVLNYAAIPNLNIANGIVLPVCNPSTATCTNDLNVQANQATMQLVTDVVGYFR
jgi:uncharacterized repeat protein (TIGR03803 family)